MQNHYDFMILTDKWGLQSHDEISHISGELSESKQRADMPSPLEQQLLRLEGGGAERLSVSQE
jgi:hypothetical protein